MKEAKTSISTPAHAPMWWAALDNMATQWPEVLATRLTDGPAALHQHLRQVVERAQIVRWQAELRHPGLDPARLDEMARLIFAPDNLETTGAPPAMDRDLEAKLDEFRAEARAVNPLLAGNCNLCPVPKKGGNP